MARDAANDAEVIYSDEEDSEEEDEATSDDESENDQTKDISIKVENKREENDLWRVRCRKGAVVRADIALDSQQVSILPFGTVVRVIEQRQLQTKSILRCRIDSPLAGWLSKKSIESCVIECRELARLTATALILRESTTNIRIRSGFVGELECDIVAATHRPSVAIVLAHGSGTKEDMITAARSLIEDCDLKNAAIFLPHGQCCRDEGGAWWPPAEDELANIRLRLQCRIESPDLLARFGLTSEIEPSPHQGVRAAVVALLSTVDGAARLTELDSRKHVILAGFDQGGTCAARVLTEIGTDNDAIDIAGVALLAPASVFSFCQNLSAGGLHGSVRKMPILIAHGSDDRVVPIVISKATVVDLRRAGAKRVRFAKCPGTDHELSFQMLRILADFTRQATLYEIPPANNEEKLRMEEAKILRAQANRNLSFKDFLCQQQKRK